MSYAAPIAWWQGAGELTLEDWQRDLLWSSFDSRLFEQRFDGLWYLPWVHTWRRMLQAFAPNVPALIPIGEPKLVEETVCVHYAMLVNGQFVGEAVGECSRKGNNKRLTWPSALEACVSDAITRIGKRLGMNLELWEPETIRNLGRAAHHRKNPVNTDSDSHPGDY